MKLHFRAPPCWKVEWLVESCLTTLSNYTRYDCEVNWKSHESGRGLRVVLSQNTKTQTWSRDQNQNSIRLTNFIAVLSFQYQISSKFVGQFWTRNQQNLHITQRLLLQNNFCPKLIGSCSLWWPQYYSGLWHTVRIMRYKYISSLLPSCHMLLEEFNCISATYQ
jgi:hypothetical protein